MGGMSVTAAAGVPRAPQHHIVLPGQMPDGSPILSVLVKRSYRIVAGGPAERLERAASLIPGDRHFGDPMNSTVAFESDHLPFKLATDVVIHATAYPPCGAPAHEIVASVVVGTARKDIVVIGDRTAHHRDRGDPVFSDPLPFTEMPVRYEHAYGGVDVRSDPSMACAYARNHLGRGFVVRNDVQSVDNLALPNIESPNDRLTPERLCCEHVMHWERQPVADGLGWMAKYWQPRAALAGVMPGDRALERMLRSGFASVLPPDQRAEYQKAALPVMNFAFFNGASSGLVRPYLKRCERIACRNLHSTGDIVGALPDEWPSISLDLGTGNPGTLEGVLQTVSVRLDEMQLDLVWRAAFPYPGLDWLPNLRRLHVEIGEA
jgi:hypothetical protein